MKDRKRRLEMFTFFDQDGISRQLEKMAAKGWLVEKINGMSWVYRRIEPQKLHFSVTYYPEASLFDPEPSEGEETYHEFCERGGWKLACTSAQMQIFYSQLENPVPIETEPALQVESIHASAKKGFITQHVNLLCLVLLNLFQFITFMPHNPLRELADSTRLFAELNMLLLAVLCIVELTTYYRWYRKAQMLAKDGKFLKMPSTAWVQKIILALICLSSAAILGKIFFTGNNTQKFNVLLILVCILAMAFVGTWIREYCKKKKMDKTMNQVYSFVIVVLMAISFTGIMVFTTLNGTENGWFAEEKETYEYDGNVWEITHDEIPLSLADFADIDTSCYTEKIYGEESFLLGRWDVFQRPRYDAENFKELPDLDYTIVDVKLGFLYDFCKKELIGDRENHWGERQAVYEPEDAESWGAKEAWRLRNLEYGVKNQYLLLWEDRMVEIRLPEEPTEEQKKIIAEKLARDE